MPKLIAALIRHADYRQRPDTPSAHQPFPLSGEGEAQARQAGVALRDAVTRNGWTLSAELDSSPLLRAWQTAQIIGAALADLFPNPAQVNAYEALAERGLGSANNLSIKQIEAVIHDDPRFPDLPADWKSNSRFCLPLLGAESLLESGERVARHMEQQMATLASHTEVDTLKLFVGHGAAFRHAAYHLGVLPFEQIARLSMFHATPVYLEYRPASGWQHIAGAWKVRNTGSAYTD